MTREESIKATFAALGSNRVEQTENVRTSVSKIGRSGNVLTVAEEIVEGRSKAGLQDVIYTREGGLACGIYESYVRLAMARTEAELSEELTRLVELRDRPDTSAETRAELAEAIQAIGWEQSLRDVTDEEIAATRE